MTAYDQLTSRVDAAGLIPPPVVTELQTTINRTSIATTLFQQVPMSNAQSKVAVIDALPHAYWVNGDTGIKQTTKVAWAGKILTAEEMAVIVPIPEAVIADASVDLWARIRPLLAAAFSYTLDSAVLFGTNRPASFSPAIVPGAAAATPTQAISNADPVQAVSDALNLLETNDTDVETIVGRANLRGYIRTKLAALGGSSELGAAPDAIFGYPLVYPGGTLTWPAKLEAIMGDWDAAMLGVRQDITYKILSEAVISDASGVVIFNLAQQDAVALRAVARYGFQVGDSLHVGPTGDLAKTYPFATASLP